MKRVPLLVLLALAGCGFGVPDPIVPAGTAGSFVAGYHPWWSGRAWSGYRLAELDRLYLFEFELSPRGDLADTHGWPGGWVGLLDAASRAGVSVAPVITLHPEAAVEQLLLDPAAIDRAAASIGELVRAHPELDGVHLDLEVFRPLPEAARSGYVHLARGVRERLDRLDRPTVLSIFLPGLDIDDAYDEAALARIADYVVVQGYDLHHRTGGWAGPVAPVAGWPGRDWELVVDRLTGLGLNPASMVMGVPLYGYRWPTEGPEAGSPTRGPGVTMPLAAAPDVLPELPRADVEAARYGTLHDGPSGSPYYAYLDQDGWVQGWFEDEASLRAKRDFVTRRGLGGVAYFPLAYAPRWLWPEIRPSGAR